MGAFHYYLQALENIIALAWSSKYHSKSHSIAFCVINEEAQNLGVIPVKGDFKKVQSVISTIKSMVS